MPMKVILLSSEISVMSSISEYLQDSWKKLVFIDTASRWQEWDLSWLRKQQDAISKAWFQIDIYTIEWKNINDFERELSQYDIIHIWWWNTAYLLYHVKQSWFDMYLKNIRSCKNIIWSSAWAVILWNNIDHIQWFDDFSIVEEFEYQGLSFINFRLMVHFWEQKYQKKFQENFEKVFRKFSNILYINDDSYLVLENETFRLINVNQD
jgi:peptidase E